MVRFTVRVGVCKCGLTVTYPPVHPDGATSSSVKPRVIILQKARGLSGPWHRIYYMHGQAHVTFLAPVNILQRNESLFS